MAYVSLYRKYRPQTFDDVVGQDHVTRTLRNAIEEDRLSHAYLFTGPRGTGKTSTARILAKAINCEQGPTSTPCGACIHCTSITDGSSVDVIELDMASHGGVDDARELRDRALFAPASARRKVYILDEVHMASTAAFNALLKLIEEPPGHVLFAMATTDPQKVLPTIMSRVQRLDLRRVGAGALADHVRTLCANEDYTIDDGAIESVVRAGDGSVRDTLSVLEQVLAYAGRDVTAEAVAQTLGQTPVERVLDTVDLLGSRDLAGLLGVVQALLDDGHDLRRFTLDLTQHLRDLLVLQVAPDRPDLVDATDERRRRLQAQTTVLPRATLLRAVERLAATITEQRQGSPRLPLELALAQLAVPGADGDVAELADRVARLEAGGSRGSASAEAPAARYRPTARGDRQATGADDPTGAPPSPPAPAPAGPTESPSSSPASAPSGSTETPASAPAPVPDPARPAPGDPPAPAAADPTGGDPTNGDPTSGDPANGDPTAEAAATPSAPSETDDGTDPPPRADAAESEPSASGPAQPAPNPAASADPDDPGDPAPTADTADTVEATAAAPADAGASSSPFDALDSDGDGTADELELLQAHWDGILELIKQGSRRHHAMIEPAVPVGVSRGILTLRYGRRHASFHAVQARSGELDGALRAAIEQACGLRLRLDVKVEGEDERRRPVPPSVTPADARTPVLDDGAAGSPSTQPRDTSGPQAQADDGDADAPDEGAQVREAELGGDVTRVDVEELLVTELDAQLVDELPPPGTDT